MKNRLIKLVALTLVILMGFGNVQGAVSNQRSAAREVGHLCCAGATFVGTLLSWCAWTNYLGDYCDYKAIAKKYKRQLTKAREERKSDREIAGAAHLYLDADKKRAACRNDRKFWGCMTLAIFVGGSMLTSSLR